MKVFIDTNILVDYLGQRDEFYLPAAQIFELAQQKNINLCISALSFATASYLLERFSKISKQEIVQLFAEIDKFCMVSPVNSYTFKVALMLGFSDFEDAMQYVSALQCDADVIVTRNKEDFIEDAIKIMSPQEFLDSLIRR